MHIQSLWYNGLLGTEFSTEDQQSIKIVQFGFWNHAAGPDFNHAVIEIDGVKHLGCIEIDLTPDHWTLHGHDVNPAYNEVILHVVCNPAPVSSFTRSEDHSHIPRITIDTDALKAALDLPSRVKFPSLCSAMPGRCATPFSEFNMQSINRVLMEAARHRISLKANKSNTTQRTHGTEQALWVQFAETLGYRPNSMHFRILAQRLPIHRLKNLPEDEIEALVFGVAGLLHPDIHKKAEPESQEWLENLWETWWRIRHDFELAPSRSIPWVLSGIRPVNHPQRRLAALASVAKNWSLITKRIKQHDSLKEILLGLSHTFWTHHYTLTSKRSPKPMKIFGEERFGAFTINHLLPDLIQSDCETASNIYFNLPAPVLSEPVNRAATRLLGNSEYKKEFLKKAWHHQALIQIYKDFCLTDTSDCAECRFPKQLIDWANTQTR